MRLEGRKRLGYFPLPRTEALRIRSYLTFPASTSTALDPCVGDGGALSVITASPQVVRYGIELDAYRAEQAGSVIHEIVQGSTFDVHCPAESLSCIYLNPRTISNAARDATCASSSYFWTMSTDGLGQGAC
jgi:hypothetical protein